MCAVIKRGILGGFSNKIGNVVGTSWKGIAVMKSLPLSVANPRTLAQLNQRGRFANLSSMGSSILAPIIKPLWDRFAQQESGFNEFMRTNMEAMDEAGNPDIETFQISKGKMNAVNPTTVVADASASTVVVTWPTTLTDAYADPTDLAYIAVWNHNGTVLRGFGGTVPRSAGTATVSVPSMIAGEPTDVFLAFKRVDGTVVSNTGAKNATIQP